MNIDALIIKWILFITVSLLTVFASVMMVTRRNPIHSALWLIGVFSALAVIYLLLGAQFIAVAQVLVYAGAIMMLILFVIMLVKMEMAQAEEVRRKSSLKFAGAVLTLILFLELVLIALSFYMSGAEGPYTPQVAASVGNVAALGDLLYKKYLFPFEIASILLLVGIVGAVLLAKGRRSKGLEGGSKET